MDQPKEQEAAIVENPMATIVVTMDTKTGDIRLAGNVLIDQELTIKMLIEAAHCAMNKPVQKMN